MMVEWEDVKLTKHELDIIFTVFNPYLWTCGRTTQEVKESKAAYEKLVDMSAKLRYEMTTNK